MTAPRVTRDDLIGSVIKHASLGDGENEPILTIETPDGRSFYLSVMSDPEGNGPGALHVFDGQSGKFIGILGGL